MTLEKEPPLSSACVAANNLQGKEVPNKVNFLNDGWPACIQISVFKCACHYAASTRKLHLRLLLGCGIL